MEVSLPSPAAKEDSYWWEKAVLVFVMIVYVIFPLVAFINRRQRRAQSRVSDAMRECENCSVDLAHSLVPEATLPEYRFRGMRLKMSAIHVGFDNVGVKLKSNGRCILEGVTGAFRPRKMAAIMGPSGAGKTTFMNAICGRAYYGTGVRNKSRACSCPRRLKAHPFNAPSLQDRERRDPH